jgi:outer membrane lipoprotein-sorting protein
VSARRLVSSAALLALALTGAGCAGAFGSSRPLLAAEARRAIELLQSRWEGFSDLRTLAALELGRDGHRQAFHGVLLLQAPTSLRFEALSPLGQPLRVVVIHEGRLTAYDATAHEAVVAPATADTAARLLGLPFEPAELVGLLAGRPRPPGHVTGARFLPTDQHGRPLVLTGTTNELQVWMDFDTGVVSRLEVSGGRSDARVTYRLDPTGRPLGFDLSLANDFLTGSVGYRNPVFGAGIDPERFRFTIPEGAKIEQLR